MAKNGTPYNHEISAIKSLGEFLYVAAQEKYLTLRFSHYNHVVSVKEDSMLDSRSIQDAFTSMLRTDYIPLKDTERLNLLSRYYVDYFGYVSQIVANRTN